MMVQAPLLSLARGAQAPLQKSARETNGAGDRPGQPGSLMGVVCISKKCRGKAVLQSDVPQFDV